MPDNELKHRHHTVPRFHLRRFATLPHKNKHPQLMRVELPGHKPHLMSVNDATVEIDFYLTEKADGTVTDAMENFLGLLETAAAEAIRELVDNRIWPVTTEIRDAIAAWAAMQYLRVPVARERLAITQEVINRIINGGIGASRREPTPEGPQTHTGPDRFPRADRERFRDLHLRSMRDSHRAATQNLCNRGWTLIRFERKALITSDTPVTLLPVPDADERTPLGLASNGGILVPLDRRVALLMTAPDDEDVLCPGTTRDSRGINQEIVLGARRVVFHHPEDAPLDSLHLPEPHPPEIGFERMTTV